MNTSNNDLKEILLEKFEDLKNFLFKNIKIVLPVVLLVCVLITVFVAVSANNKKAEDEAVAVETEPIPEETAVATIATPEVALEENAYTDVNDFIGDYYSAMAEGDIDHILQMNNYIPDIEKITIEENSKYIEEYKDIDVYTKAGPVEGSYIAYVYSETKFKDYETVVPGMQAFYLCTDDNNELYINDGDESTAVTSYIREVSLQDDVVDLNNKVAVAYNDMLAEDEDLSAFLVDLTETIVASVGESLAAAEGSETEETVEETEEENGGQTVLTKVTKVKATDVVNIRTSDSETADKLGKASVGEEFTLLEERGNGWSKIEYQGKEAFMKSEYLEASAEEVVVTDNSATEEQTEETAGNDASANDNAQASGTVTVKENVRIRAGASETAEKIATAYRGEKLDLVMKQADGWTKIKYNGKTAYVKSEYVE